MGKTTENKQDFIYDEIKARAAEELRPWLHRVVQNRKMTTMMEYKLQAMQTFPASDLHPSLISQWQRDCEKIVMEQRDIQSNLKSDLSRIFRPIKKIRRFSIRSIQLFSEVFLKEYRAAINIANGGNEFERLSDEDLDYLGKVATSIYLERWLEKDRCSYKTMNAFSKYGYGDKDSSKLENPVDDKEKCSRLYRAYDKYHQLFILRQKQTREDRENMPFAPYKRDNKTAHDLITLSWCNAWEKKHLKILEFWLFRKHFINKKSKRDTHKNETLCDILRRYTDLLLNTGAAYADAQKEPSKIVEFVSNCILIQKIERVYHFQFISEISQYCQQFGLGLKDFNTAIMVAYLGRYSTMDGWLFGSSNVFGPDGNRKCIRSNDPFGVLNYEKIIPTIAHTHNQEKVKAEVNKEFMRRCMLMDLLTLMYTVFPFDRQHAWEMIDFKDAADFYHNDYPIISSYTSDEEFPPNTLACSEEDREKAHGFYDLYHEFYIHIYNMEGSPLKVAVEKFTRSRHVAEEY